MMVCQKNLPKAFSNHNSSPRKMLFMDFSSFQILSVIFSYGIRDIGFFTLKLNQLFSILYLYECCETDFFHAYHYRGQLLGSDGWSHGRPIETQDWHTKVTLAQMVLGFQGKSFFWASASRGP
jgi:hypothetical protein